MELVPALRYCRDMSTSAGDLLRSWRQRRRLSQLALASDAEISTRHLSFVETGRSRPSRDMVLRLSERLGVPLRERNSLLVAAGHAPEFGEHRLDESAMDAARAAVEMVLEAHNPYPALAIDRHWNLVAANRSVAPFLSATDGSLLEPPVNVLRLSLHPGGLASRIRNLHEWREHILERLRRQIDVSGDSVLVDLMNELRALAVPAPQAGKRRDFGGVLIPLELMKDGVTLSFFSTTTVFGTPVDITLAELAIESFFPADEETRAALR